jgi:hypothetical protein
MHSTYDEQLQRSSIALIALELPDQPLTSAQVILALNKAYQAGVRDTTHKFACRIVRGGRGLREQAL